MIASPGALRAQSCGLTDAGAGERDGSAEVGGVGGGVGASVGVASYRTGGGVSGVSYGVDGSAGLEALGGVSMRAGYRGVNLNGRRADLGRIAVGVPLPLPFATGPIAVCGVGHAGVAKLPVRDAGTTVLAGGAGLRLATRLALGAAWAVPYAELRGLAARSTGTLLGVDVEADGLAMGLEAGVAATLGRGTLRLAAAVDGFADGLGVTPYPSATAEVGIGIRF